MIKRLGSNNSFMFFSRGLFKMRSGKKGQVWVETVIYTLIGLAIMGLILAMAKPKIDCKKDEIVIDQAKEAIRNINDKIYEVQKASANRRAVDLTVGSGKVTIDMDNDAIYWEIETKCKTPYSEPGLDVLEGDLNITTVGEAAPWKVVLGMDYNVDLKYDDQSSGTKDISEAPSAYTLIIENKGKNADGDIMVDIREA